MGVGPGDSRGGQAGDSEPPVSGAGGGPAPGGTACGAPGRQGTFGGSAAAAQTGYLAHAAGSGVDGGAGMADSVAGGSVLPRQLPG